MPSLDEQLGTCTRLVCPETGGFFSGQGIERGLIETEETQTKAERRERELSAFLRRALVPSKELPEAASSFNCGEASQKDLKGAGRDGGEKLGTERVDWSPQPSPQPGLRQWEPADPQLLAQMGFPCSGLLLRFSSPSQNTFQAGSATQHPNRFLSQKGEAASSGLGQLSIDRRGLPVSGSLLLFTSLLPSRKSNWSLRRAGERGVSSLCFECWALALLRIDRFRGAEAEGECLAEQGRESHSGKAERRTPERLLGRSADAMAAKSLAANDALVRQRQRLALPSADQLFAGSLPLTRSRLRSRCNLGSMKRKAIITASAC